MLRNGQNYMAGVLRQFNVMTRKYATKKSKCRKLATEDANANADPPPEPSKTTDVAFEEPINPNFLARNIGATYHKWNTVLERYPLLKSLSRKDIVNSANCLKALKFDTEDILSKPMILHHNVLTIGNRYSVLQECGFALINIVLLSKYVRVMNKTVTMLKCHGHIPYDLNMRERLRACFTDLDLQLPSDISRCNEEMELKLMRQEVLNCYLRQRLEMTSSDIEKLWKVYGRVKHRSFRSVQSMVQVLLDELQFSKERIIKNAYLLHGDAENVRRILSNIRQIDGQEMREIVYRRPKLLMSSCDSLLKTLEYVKLFGIGEEAVIRCLEVLTLGPETVLERLQDMQQIEEFKVLISNPRVLRLVHYQNKARLRLEYLSQLKVRCASLHILSGGAEKFAKFARDGSDRTKGRDIIIYLSNIMGKHENDIRTLLTRHPNWCHIPVLHVKQCFDFLQNKKFPVESIYNNIHLLLYPIKRIEDKMSQLQSPELLEEMQLSTSNIYDLSNDEQLTLILYLIECEFHFTGDGVWTEQHTQPVENFNNLLPDFPESLNKIYKYGVKPAATINNSTSNASSRRQEVLAQGT